MPHLIRNSPSLLRPLVAFLTAIILMLALVPATIAAPKEYGIKILGKEVTSQNAKNILDDDSASVSYDAASKTLTLKNAQLDNHKLAGDDRYYVIDSEADINIKVLGENRVINFGNTEFGNAITTNNLRFIGDGTLQVKGGTAAVEDMAIIAKNITVDGPQIQAIAGGAANAPSHGIYAETLTIKSGDLSSRGGYSHESSTGILAGSIKVLGGRLDGYGGKTISPAQPDSRDKPESVGIRVFRGEASFNAGKIQAGGEDFALDVETKELSINEDRNVDVSTYADGTKSTDWDRQTSLLRPDSPYTFVIISDANPNPTTITSATPATAS